MKSATALFTTLTIAIWSYAGYLSYVDRNYSLLGVVAIVIAYVLYNIKVETV